MLLSMLSSIATQADLPNLTQKVLIENRLHSFEHEARVRRPPRSPVSGFVFENAVIIPFASYVSLYAELLELLKWSGHTVPRVEKDDGCPEFVHEVHDGPFVVSGGILQRSGANHITRPLGAVRIGRGRDRIHDRVDAYRRFESGFSSNEGGHCQETSGPGAKYANALIIDQAFRRKTVESKQRVADVVIAALPGN